MAMSVTVYKYSGETNRLDKSSLLTGAITTSAEIKGVFRADAPELHLNYDGQLAGYNYLSVSIAPGIDYYYYARITAELGQTYRASCTRDPLMSFSSQIAARPIIARRSSLETDELTQPGCNAYLADSEQPVLIPTIEDFYLLHTFDPDHGSYVLVTIG